MARQDGDDYVIDGGKMWTTNGTQADWMCCLANTGGDNAHMNKVRGGRTPCVAAVWCCVVLCGTVWLLCVVLYGVILTLSLSLFSLTH